MWCWKGWIKDLKNICLKVRGNDDCDVIKFRSSKENGDQLCDYHKKENR